jgi:hypothetical protein
MPIKLATAEGRQKSGLAPLGIGIPARVVLERLNIRRKRVVWYVTHSLMIGIPRLAAILKSIEIPSVRCFRAPLTAFNTRSPPNGLGYSCKRPASNVADQEPAFRRLSAANLSWVAFDDPPLPPRVLANGGLVAWTMSTSAGSPRAS